MSRFRALVAVCALVATVAVLGAGCGASAEVAADVGGIEYAADDLDAYLATTDPANDARARRADAAAWLTDWVFFTAAELELADRGVAVTNAHEAQAVADITQADPSFVPGAPGGDVAVRQRAVRLAALEWVEREVPVTVSGEVLRHLCSRHILVASQTEANEVLSRLDAGEDFRFLAVELSLDPGSGSLGGDLGCVLEGTFVAPFEDAAYPADPGDVVVAESQFGFHVIEVLSSGPATAENHPQLDAEILARMVEDADQEALVGAQGEVQAQRNQLLVGLQEAVVEDYAPRVHVNDLYGRWDPDGFRVVSEASP